MYNILVRIPNIENIFCYDYQTTTNNELALYIKNFILYLIKTKKNIDPNIKFTNNLKFFINNSKLKVNLIIYFNTENKNNDYILLNKYDYILFNLNNYKSNLDSFKKPLITYYPNIYIIYNIIESKKDKNENENVNTISLNNIDVIIIWISTLIFSNLMLNKIIINPYEDFLSKKNRFNDTIKKIRFFNLNKIYDKYIDIYKNHDKINDDFEHTRKFILSFDKNLDINMLKNYNEKLNYLENLNYENKHFIKIHNYNDIVNYNIIMHENEINKLSKEIEKSDAAFYSDNINSEINKKIEEINKLQKKLLPTIDNIENANIEETKFNLFNNDYDISNFWNFEYYKLRQDIFMNFRFVILNDSFQSNTSLLDKIIEVYLAGAIPLFKKKIYNGNILNNNILDNIIIPDDIDDKFLEKIFTTYSYEYFIATSFINNNDYDKIINKEQNLEKIFNDNYLLDNFPEYLNTNYFDKLGDLIIKHINNTENIENTENG